MKIHEIIEDHELTAEPVDGIDPISRKPAINFRIMRGNVMLTTIAGRFAKTPAAAIAHYQASSTAREPDKPQPTKSRPIARKIAPVRANLLYHFTTANGLRGILDDNRILANTTHIVNRRSLNGVSLTRDANFDYETTKPFRLTLDPTILQRQHRVLPVRAGEVQHIHKADAQNDQYGNEAEEFVVGAITHLDRCLRGVAVRTDLLPAGFDLDALSQSLDIPITTIKPLKRS